MSNDDIDEQINNVINRLSAIELEARSAREELSKLITLSTMHRTNRNKLWGHGEGSFLTSWGIQVIKIKSRLSLFSSTV